MQLVRVRDMGRAEVRETEEGGEGGKKGEGRRSNPIITVYHTVYDGEMENVRRENKNRLNTFTPLD